MRVCVELMMTNIDDDEHFRRELGAPAVEEHAGHLDLVDFVRVMLSEEAQPGDSVLAVNDQILALRLTEKADGVRVPHFLKAQRLIGEEQHGTRNHRLGNHGLIEIDDLFDLLTIQDTLKASLVSFDARNELGDLIMLRDPALRDLFSLEVIPAGKPNLIQKISRLI